MCPSKARASSARAGSTRRTIYTKAQQESADGAISLFNRYLHNTRGAEPLATDIEKNKQTIRDFYERSHAGDLDVYDELFAPEFVSYSSAAGGEVRGPVGFKAADQMYAAAFPDFMTTIDMIIAEGNLVMVYGPATGTDLGPFMGIEPTGRSCGGRASPSTASTTTA